MRRVFILIAALGACASASAASGTAPRTDADACVFIRSVHDFRALDRDSFVLWAPSRRHAYLVELSMPLPELEFAHRLAFVDRDHDGRVCGRALDRVLVEDTGLAHPVTIAGMTRLDETQLAQLEAQHGVQLTRKPAHPDRARGDESPQAQP